MNTAPLGVFDSGIGGLTVARALFERLPDAHGLPVREHERVGKHRRRQQLRVDEREDRTGQQHLGNRLSLFVSSSRPV